MSPVLIVSVLVRAVAAVWSLSLLGREEGRRYTFFCLTLFVMTGQLMVWILSVEQPLEIRLESDMQAVLGLSVSVLALLAVFHLGRSRERSVEASSVSGEPPSDGRQGRGLALTAVVVGGISIVASIAVGYAAFLSSRAVIRETVAKGNMAFGKNVASQALAELVATGHDRDQVLQRLDQIWRRTEVPFQNSYLCVIERPGKIAMHTSKPEMAGTEVGQVVITENAKKPLTVANLLQRHEGWYGQNTNYRGVRQLVGYHYVDSLDLLLAVHVPTSTVDAEFHGIATPWSAAMATLIGLLLPLSFGLLYLNYSRAEQVATARYVALRESELRFAEMLDGLAQLVWVMDPSGVYHYFNRPWLEFTGRRMLDESGDGWLNRIHPEDRETYVRRSAAAVEAREPFELEFRLQGRDKKYRWMLCNATPAKDAQGRFTGYIGSCLDVTERKRVSDALAISEERYRGFVENSSEGIYLCEFDTPMPIDLPEDEQIVLLATGCRITICNDVFARMYGFDSGREMLGKRAIELYGTHGNEANDAFLRNLVRQNYRVVEQVSEEFDRHGRRVIFANNCLGIVENGRLLRVWGTQRDITEWASIQQELRIRDRAFTSSGHGIVIVDATSAEHPAIYCNPALERMTGCSQHEVVGQPYDFLQAADADRQATIRSAMDRGEEIAMTLFTPRKDGSRFWSELRISPVNDPEGRLTHFLGQYQDISERKSAEEALRNSEKRYRSLITATAATVWRTDPTGQFIAPQDSWQSYTGQPWEQQQGWGWAQMLHPEDRQYSVERWKAAVAELADLFSSECRAWCKETAEYHHSVVRAVPIRDEHGTLQEWVGATIDVREQRAAVERLRRTQFTIDHSADVVLWIEIEGRLSEVNEAGCRLLGYSREELLGMSVQDLDPTLAEASMRSLLEHLGSHGALIIEVQPRRKNGEVVPLEFSVNAMQFGDERFACAIGRDLRERKQAERVHRDLISRTQTLLETTLDGYILADQGGQLLDVNPAYCEMIGYERDELLGMNIRHLEAALDSDEVQRRINTMLELGRDRFETRHHHRKGHFVDLDVSISVLRQDAQPALVAAFVRDISVQKKSERRLRASEETLRQLNRELEVRVAGRTAELKEKNEELTSFAHSVSHDLRAPLRAMEGFARALDEDYSDQLDDAGREFIQHIVHSARRMDQLVNDLLAYSHLGREELRIQLVSLQRASEDALLRLESELASRNAHVDVAADLPVVQGHHSTVVQVITNLVSNAIKFVPAASAPRVNIRAEERPDCIRLWVEDNGIGIRTEFQRKIFQVFERLHGIEAYPGTGIGLAIVSRAAERLRGACGVESHEGKGSRFWVEFPREEQTDE